MKTSLFILSFCTLLFMCNNHTSVTSNLIDIKEYAGDRISFGSCNKNQAKENLLVIREAIALAKDQGKGILFPSEEIHLSPVFTSDKIHHDFKRVKNRGTDYIINNDYYTYEFLNLTQFNNVVDGNGCKLIVDGMELYDIIVNEMVGRLNNVCVSDISGAMSFEQLKSNPNKANVSKYLNELTQVDPNCAQAGNNGLRIEELLQEDNLPNTNKQKALFRILRSYWFAVILIESCDADSKLKISNMTIEDQHNTLVSDKLFDIIGLDNESGIHELSCGFYITNCDLGDNSFSQPMCLPHNSDYEFSMLNNITVKGLGNGFKIQTSKNLVASNLLAEGFTDTGFNLNNSENCWLIHSEISGGNDGNCTMYGGNNKCGFSNCTFQDLGRSYQLAVIEGSDNCVISCCKILKSSESKCASSPGNYNDPYANHRAITVNRSSNSYIYKNEIFSAETGITIRNTDLVDRFIGQRNVRGTSENTICHSNIITNLVDRKNKDGTQGNGAIGFYLEASNNNEIQDNTVRFGDCGQFVLFADRGNKDPFDALGHCTSIIRNEVHNLSPDIINVSYGKNPCIDQNCAETIYDLKVEDNDFYDCLILGVDLYPSKKGSWGYSRYAFDFYPVFLENCSFKRNTVHNIRRGSCLNNVALANPMTKFVADGSITFEDNVGIVFESNACLATKCNNGARERVNCLSN